jgi:hypothetical protein
MILILLFNPIVTNLNSLVMEITKKIESFINLNKILYHFKKINMEQITE